MNSQLEKEIRKSLKKKYQVEKYLGTKNNNSNYLVNNNQEKYLIQIIPRQTNHNDVISQIAFLNHLSQYKSSQKYIRQCLDFGITPKNIIMVHKWSNEKSLGEYLESISSYPIAKYYTEIKRLMVKILHTLVYIHRKGVVHQNLDFENILIKEHNKKPNGGNNGGNNNDLDIILTDFQYSCGNYLSKSDQKIHSEICSRQLHLEKNKTPPESNYKEDLIKKIKGILKDENQNIDLVYLYLAKKFDVWLLGIIFWKMINRQKNDVNPSLVDFDPHNFQKYQGVESAKLERLHKFIVETMLSKIPKRMNPKDILGEIMVKEKYGWNLE